MANPNFKEFLLSGAKAKTLSQPIGITAIGVYMPEKNISNAEFNIDIPAEVNFDQAFGIFNRRVGDGGEREVTKRAPRPRE